MKDASTNELRNKYQQVIDELDKLDLSNQLYHIEIGGTGNSFRPGGISYDINNDWVSIVFDGTNDDLAHELKHAYQFEVGEISYSSRTGSWVDLVRNESGQYYNMVLLYDLSDEVAAYERGALYGGKRVDEGYISNIYKFRIEGTNIYYYPFLERPIHGSDNIYGGCINKVSLPSHVNPDSEFLRGNIFRLNGQTYKK